MKRALIVPVVVAFLASGCDDSTAPGPHALVRYFNATTGMSGSGGFTVNGVFATGSALGPGQSTQTCRAVSAGATTFGFGPVDAKGATGLSGNPLATLNDQSIADGGNIIVAATGSPSFPQLFLFDNDFPGQLGATQAAVRFVNLAPGTDATANTYVVFAGAIGLGTLLASNIAVGAPTAFSTVAGGSNEFSILKLPGHVVAVEGTAATLDLQAGSVNTVAIVQNASGEYQLINLPRCS